MFQVGDKVFVKVKGYPYWPARINPLPSEVKVPKGKYPIFFYGTHEVYFVPSKDIRPYDTNKEQLGQPNRKHLFNEGLAEIEENPDVLLYGKDPEAEAYLRRFYKFTSSASSPGEVSPSTPVPPESDAPLLKRKRSDSISSYSSSGNDTIGAEDPSYMKLEVEKPVPVKKRAPQRPSVSVAPSLPTVEEDSPAVDLPPTMNALGRPMRASAKRFSATKLLHGGYDSEGGNSGESHPTSAKQSTTVDSATDQASAETHLPLKKRRLGSQSSNDGEAVTGPIVKLEPSLDSLHPIPQQYPRGPEPKKSSQSRRVTFVESTVAKKVEKKGVKVEEDPLSDLSSPSSSSFSPPQSSASTKPHVEPAANNRTKATPSTVPVEEDDATMEARLLVTVRDIKAALVIGQENFTACIAALESIRKGPLRLVVLARVPEVSETIKKCRKYKLSDKVKLAAQEVFTRFVELSANASPDEIRLAEIETLKRRRQQQQRLIESQQQAAQITQESQSHPPVPVSVPVPVPETRDIDAQNEYHPPSSTTPGQNEPVDIKPTASELRASVTSSAAPPVSTELSSKKTTNSTSSPSFNSDNFIRLLSTLCESRDSVELQGCVVTVVDRYDRVSTHHNQNHHNHGHHHKVSSSSSHRPQSHHPRPHQQQLFTKQLSSSSSSSQQVMSPVSQTTPSSRTASSLDERIARIMRGHLPSH